MSYAGRYYHLDGANPALGLPLMRRPRLTVGGGGFFELTPDALARMDTFAAEVAGPLVSG